MARTGSQESENYGFACFSFTLGTMHPLLNDIDGNYDDQ
jgi:hypothetical protein